MADTSAGSKQNRIGLPQRDTCHQAGVWHQHKGKFDARAVTISVRLVVRDDEGQMSATSKAADVP